MSAAASLAEPPRPRPSGIRASSTRRSSTAAICTSIPTRADPQRAARVPRRRRREPRHLRGRSTRRHPDDDEGLLSARRAAIVSTAGLARLAARIDARRPPPPRRGRGEPRRPAAAVPPRVGVRGLCGALYLDLGYEAVRDWLLALAAPELDADRPDTTSRAPRAGSRSSPSRRPASGPQYRVVDATGPDHEKTFQIEVAVDGRALGGGGGPSRRSRRDGRRRAGARDPERRGRLVRRARPAGAPGPAVVRRRR